MKNGKLTVAQIGCGAFAEAADMPNFRKCPDADVKWCCDVSLERVLATMNAGTVHRLVSAHGIEPMWPRVWEKARTGGSDDHGALNIGRTWTEVRAAGSFALLVVGRRLVF